MAEVFFLGWLAKLFSQKSSNRLRSKWVRETESVCVCGWASALELLRKSGCVLELVRKECVRVRAAAWEMGSQTITVWKEIQLMTRVLCFSVIHFWRLRFLLSRLKLKIHFFPKKTKRLWEAKRLKLITCRPWMSGWRVGVIASMLQTTFRPFTKKLFEEKYYIMSVIGERRRILIQKGIAVKIAELTFNCLWIKKVICFNWIMCLFSAHLSFVLIQFFATNWFISLVARQFNSPLYQPAPAAPLKLPCLLPKFWFYRQCYVWLRPKALPILSLLSLFPNKWITSLK